MSVFEYFLLFFSVITGGGIAFFLNESKRIRLDLILSFTGAYILGITVLHLMPGIFSSGQVSTGIWVLIGFFIQLFLEQLSQGVEHGHIHAHKHAHASFAISIMIGLCLHAFIEGLPLSSYPEFYHAHHAEDHQHHNHLLYGIIMHKAPAAFVLVLVLLRSGFTRSFIILLLIIFASMSPAGALISEQFIGNLEHVEKMLAIVVGSFLHISTTILFEADDTQHHKISWSKLLVIFIGTALALSTIL
jgi:zinc transporter ZupT